MKTFQTLFPPLSPQTLSLSSARRVVLVAYNPERGTVDFRHYLITVKPYGVSRRMRRVLEGAVKSASASTSKVAGKGYLDLGNEKDVADFFLRKKGEAGPGSDGYESAVSDASSAAGDDADAVSLADDYVGRNNRKGQKRAVKLDEIGPRMELRLIKISEGVPGREGAVIHHEFVKKTKAEIAALKAEHKAKEKLRKQRRDEQERNVQRKKEEAVKKTGTAVNSEDGEVDEGYGDEENKEEDEESEGPEKEAQEYEDDGEWDDEEDVSDEENDGSDSDGSAEESSESEDEALRPPPKKPKLLSKR